MPKFARPFRLHHPDGQHFLLGAQFPSGRVIVESRMGFHTSVTVDDLLHSEPHGSRIEWADELEASTDG